MCYIIKGIRKEGKTMKAINEFYKTHLENANVDDRNLETWYLIGRIKELATNGYYDDSEKIEIIKDSIKMFEEWTKGGKQ